MWAVQRDADVVDAHLAYCYLNRLFGISEIVVFSLEVYLTFVEILTGFYVFLGNVSRLEKILLSTYYISRSNILLIVFLGGTCFWLFSPFGDGLFICI